MIDVLKNDLAGGTMPCIRLLANAAWFLLNVVAYNVLAVMKRQSLALAWWSMRLKALRLHLLNVAGHIITHGRKLYLKIANDDPSLPIYQEAGQKLSFFSSA